MNYVQKGNNLACYNGYGSKIQILHKEIAPFNLSSKAIDFPRNCLFELLPYNAVLIRINIVYILLERNLTSFLPVTEINKFTKLRELLIIYSLGGGKASRSNAQSVRIKTALKHVALYCIA